MLAVPAVTDKPPANRAAQTGEHAETSMKPTPRNTGEGLHLEVAHPMRAQHKRVASITADQPVGTFLNISEDARCRIASLTVIPPRHTCCASWNRYSIC